MKCFTWVSLKDKKHQDLEKHPPYQLFQVLIALNRELENRLEPLKICKLITYYTKISELI